MDKVGAADHLTVGFGEVTDAVYPCPKCKRESKEHKPLVESVPGEEDRVISQRICAMPTCRYEGVSDEFVRVARGTLN